MSSEFCKEQTKRPVWMIGEGPKTQKREALGGQLREFGFCSESIERGSVIGFLLEGYFVLCRMDWRGRQGDPLETSTRVWGRDGKEWMMAW